MTLPQGEKQSHLRSKTGFTIVELLIVIVVIGILAAITIVSYNGVTQRANTTSAQSAAQSVVMKAETFNAEIGRYPVDTSELTGQPTKPYYLAPTAVAFTLGTSAPSQPNTVKFLKCGLDTGSEISTQADIIPSNITGVRVYYWTYTGTPNANAYVTAGTDTGTNIECPTS